MEKLDKVTEIIKEKYSALEANTADMATGYEYARSVRTALGVLPGQYWYLDGLQKMAQLRATYKGNRWHKIVDNERGS